MKDPFFPNDSNSYMKTLFVYRVVETVEKLLQEPSSSKDGHFGVAAELADKYTAAVILRSDRREELSEDDRVEIAVTAGVVLDESWVISAKRRQTKA